MKKYWRKVFWYGLIITILVIYNIWILSTLPLHTKTVQIDLDTYQHEVELANAPHLPKAEFAEVMRPAIEEEKLVEQVDRSKFYTEKEVQCLARNIYFEARDQSILGQYHVAWVTINRVNNKKWASDVCGVVWQRKQFSWTHDGKSDQPKEIQVFAIAKLIAEDTLYDARTDGDDFSKGALYYHAEYVAPYWSKKLDKISQIDSHIFYK